jgi:hypothetical protein
MATQRPKTPGRVKALEDKLAPGRPRKVAPPDAAAVIRKVCATGANKRSVAMALGAGDMTILDRWMDEDPALKQAFDEGREIERKTLHSVLYDCAVGGQGKDSLIAAMFLLKARHGYQEGQQEAKSNRVSINFQIPAATPLAQFMTVENEPRTQSVPAKITRTA